MGLFQAQKSGKLQYLEPVSYDRRAIRVLITLRGILNSFEAPRICTFMLRSITNSPGQEKRPALGL